MPKERNLLFYGHCFTEELQCQATTTLCDSLRPGTQQPLLRHRVFSTGLLISSFFCFTCGLGTKTNIFSQAHEQ